MPAGKLDRWLKNAEPYTDLDDWGPTEYFRWIKRLHDAKDELHNTYRKVDGGLMADVQKMSMKAKEAIVESGVRKTPQIVHENVAKLIVRYIAAYNFYVRATFEEVPDNALVSRAQSHFVDLGIGMLDKDIAQMLQAAADKVPLKKILHEKVNELVKMVKDSAPVIKEYKKDGLGGHNEIQFIKMANSTRVDGGLPDHKAIPEIFSQIITEQPKPSYYDRRLGHLKKTFNSDQPLDTFLTRRGDPQLDGYHDEDEILAIEKIASNGDLDKLVKTAIKSEADNCSWDADVGPAVKAISRLGRVATDVPQNSLAQYAREQQKPSL